MVLHEANEAKHTDFVLFLLQYVCLIQVSRFFEIEVLCSNSAELWMLPSSDSPRLHLSYPVTIIPYKPFWKVMYGALKATNKNQEWCNQPLFCPMTNVDRVCAVDRAERRPFFFFGAHWAKVKGKHAVQTERSRGHGFLRPAWSRRTCSWLVCRVSCRTLSLLTHQHPAAFPWTMREGNRGGRSSLCSCPTARPSHANQPLSGLERHLTQ